MPWASGVLRGSGRLAAHAREIEEIATVNAEISDLCFIARCLSAKNRGVKREGEERNAEKLKLVRYDHSNHYYQDRTLAQPKRRIYPAGRALARRAARINPAFQRCCREAA